MMLLMRCDVVWCNFTTFSPPNNANEDDVHRSREMSDVKCTVAKELMANGQGFLKDEDFMDEEERESDKWE